MDDILYKLVRFLEYRGWVLQRETPNTLVYLSPKSIAEGKLKIKVPTDFTKNDYGRVFVNILNALLEFYPRRSDKIRILSIIKQASNIDLKWQKKEKWIVFEENSKISKYSIYEIYIPKFTWP